MSVRGLAAQARVAPAFIIDIEASRRLPGPEVLARLAEALGMPLEELQALDTRVTPEVRAWMETEPRVSTMLRHLCERPDRMAVLREIEEMLR